MEVSNKLTDERLASLIESCFDKEEMDFSDMSSFEAFSVAENAMQLVNEEEFAVPGFPFGVSNRGYRPLAMCSFLGEESEAKVDIDADSDDVDSDGQPQ